MAHDVFISYANEDHLIADKLCAALESSGISCWIAPRDNVAGKDWDEPIVEAIAASHVVVLVCSSRADASPQVKREVACAVSKRVAVLPFRIEDAPLKGLDFFLSIAHWLDASTPPLEKHLPQLTEAVTRFLPIGNKPAAQASATPEPSVATQPERAGRVALLYKRDVQPDEHVLKRLETQLTAHGYEVFIDRHLAIGVEWAKEIERQIRSADAIIPLLSAASVQSEMVLYEVEIAHDEARKNNGKPRLLPVRVSFTDRLPHDLATILDPVQQFFWEGPQDNQHLVTELIHALRNPSALKPLDPRADREHAGGVVPLDSQFYVVRPTDDEFYAAIARQ